MKKSPLQWQERVSLKELKKIVLMKQKGWLERQQVLEYVKELERKICFKRQGKIFWKKGSVTDKKKELERRLVLDRVKLSKLERDRNR